jgi:hypothetical protein
MSNNLRVRAIFVGLWVGLFSASLAWAGGHAFVVDGRALAAVLRQAPLESEAGGQAVEIGLPSPDGTWRRFAVKESPVLTAEMARRYPGIKTYAGVRVDDSTERVRFALLADGLHGTVLTSEGSYSIDPADGNLGGHRSTYLREMRASGERALRCGVSGRLPAPRNEAGLMNAADFTIPDPPTQLRIFRLAVTASAEFTAKYGGKDATVAAIASIVNRVNAIYERDASVRFMLSGTMVYTDASQQPFDDTNSSDALAINQTVLDQQVGADNYDLGHLFVLKANSGYGVFQGLCNNGKKGQGVSPLGTYTEARFASDMVAHEVGHQLDANHTFNALGSPGCGESQSSRDTAFEAGSGVTIMSYAGICTGTDPQDTDADANGFFHAYSLREILGAVAKQKACAQPITSAATNNAPQLQAPATVTIPAQTPFALTVSANDPDPQDQNNLTYSWEELDLGTASPPNDDEGTRPLFRNYPPSSSPSRMFPSLKYILNNANLPPTTYLSADGSTVYLTGETLPSTSRTMRFRAAVRDNRAADGTVGGVVAFTDVLVTVDPKSGPFQVTAPNTSVTWAAGSTQTVTWNVANTDQGPVSCASVDILFSTDGGQTFPQVLASAVPNSGSASVTIPSGSATANGRIQVRASGGVFFDISDADFTITQ